MSRADVIRSHAAQKRETADALERDAVFCDNGGQRSAYKDEAAQLRTQATNLDTQASELEAQEGN